MVWIRPVCEKNKFVVIKKPPKSFALNFDFSPSLHLRRTSKHPPRQKVGGYLVQSPGLVSSTTAVDWRCRISQRFSVAILTVRRLVVCPRLAFFMSLLFPAFCWFWLYSVFLFRMFWFVGRKAAGSIGDFSPEKKIMNWSKEFSSWVPRQVKTFVWLHCGHNETPKLMNSIICFPRVALRFSIERY